MVKILEGSNMRIIYNQLSLQLSLSGFKEEYEAALRNVEEKCNATARPPAISDPRLMREYREKLAERDQALEWLYSVLLIKKYFHVFEDMYKRGLVKIKYDHSNDKGLRVTLKQSEVAMDLFEPFNNLMPHLVRHITNDFEPDKVIEVNGELTTNYSYSHDLLSQIEYAAMMFKAYRFWTANRIAVS